MSQRRFKFGLGAIAACVTASLFVGGCDSSTKQFPKGPEITVPPDELLNTILEKLQPINLGRTSKREVAVTVLNDFWQSAEGKPNVTLDIPDDLAAQLGADQVEQAQREQFSLRDGSQIRECIFFSQIARRFAEQLNDDNERVLAIFHFVVESISLRRESTLPLTPFHSLMFGKGLAEDRAWVFASLLRQLKIDAVILRPKSNPDADGRWLVGVLLNDDVQIFDVNYGLPIPAPDADSSAVLVSKAARLSTITGDSNVLSAMVLDDQPYPLVDVELADLSVEVITDSSTWSKRMKQFEHVAGGSASARFFDPLVNDGDSAGLLQRVKENKAARWKADDVKVWTFPEQQLHAYDVADESTRNGLTALMSPFLAPAVIETRGPQRTPKGYTFDQFRARQRYLVGDYDEVRARFMSSRTLTLHIDSISRTGVAEDFPKFRAAHVAAAEDAFYWAGLTTWKEGDVETAIESMGDYLARHKRGRREDACRYALALALASEGDDPMSPNLSRAIELLDETPTSDPQRAGNRVLAARWRNR